MRELKFRVWDEKYRCWENSCFYVYSNTNILIQGRILTQFTGLLDSCHKEIYEGDLVKIDKNHEAILFDKIFDAESALSKLEGLVGEVKFVCQAFNIGWGSHGRVELFKFVTCDCCPCALKIVGNIFENPELCTSLKLK